MRPVKTDYDAKHIILATGGRSRELPALPIDGKKIIGYREEWYRPNVPKNGSSRFGRNRGWVCLFL